MLYTTNAQTTLLMGTITGALAAYMAYRRGKNPIAWFAIGFLFGLLGVIAFFFASNSAKKKRGRTRKATAKSSARPAIPQPYLTGPTDKFWYYVSGSREQVGPMSHKGITDAWKEGKVVNDSLVWHEELAEWKPLQDLISVQESKSS